MQLRISLLASLTPSATTGPPLLSAGSQYLPDMKTSFLPQQALNEAGSVMVALLYMRFILFSLCYVLFCFMICYYYRIYYYVYIIY